MSSVTKRISEIKQPRGGYIRPAQLSIRTIDDQRILYEEENVHASITGMVVDYLSRVMMGTDAMEVFRVSHEGAFIAEKMFKQKRALKTAKHLLSNIRGLDDKSISSACKLVTYDVWYRNPLAASMAKDIDDINPDINTIKNVKIMVERSILFWNEYGPIVRCGFTFEPNGYTKTVDSGDGDYLTSDGLWDLKVSKSKPTSKHTLQLLMYWIMGKHSGQKIYDNIQKLGIFNPRLNTVYTMDVRLIPQETIEEVEKNVICYK